MLRTSLCDLPGIGGARHLRPDGPHIATTELAAAVSNAGGLGIISFGGHPPPLLRQ